MRCVHCGCALFEDEQDNYLHLWSGWHNCDPYMGSPLYATLDRRAPWAKVAGAVL